MEDIAIEDNPQKNNVKGEDTESFSESVLEEYAKNKCPINFADRLIKLFKSESIEDQDKNELFNSALRGVNVLKNKVNIKPKFGVPTPAPVTFYQKGKLVTVSQPHGPSFSVNAETFSPPKDVLWGKISYSQNKDTQDEQIIFETCTKSVWKKMALSRDTYNEKSHKPEVTVTYKEGPDPE
jgi:hypothetical protein